MEQMMECLIEKSTSGWNPNTKATQEKADANLN
jgi:hypothetical protein